MIEVELSRIIIDEQKREQVVVLKDKKGGRFLPIVVGTVEAAAIRMQLNGFVPPRPLTHDLMRSLIESLGVRLEKIVIDKLVDNTFHAKLYLKTGDNGIKVIDARPSDSIALAVRTKSPLFIEEEIFKKLAESS
ncbi:MAG: bifunctional nuclease family protein [Candidatus Omnitrophota bacterium]|nr:bifunctional nuclease family protein [Candidatus Omnitrophota bacterium]